MAVQPALPKPTDLITVTVLGKTFKACRHCAAHMERTADRFAKRFPNARLVIVQGPHNSTVAASAGTHDKCAAFDISVTGLDWYVAQGWFRTQGFAAWYRVLTPGLWSAHIHMISLGCPAPVGIFIPGQIADYRAHKSGLSGHVADNTWHPENIDGTIFRWTAPKPVAPIKQAIKAAEKAATAAGRTALADRLAGIRKGIPK